MRFLVKRWHKATGGSSSSTVNRNGVGQSIGKIVLFFSGGLLKLELPCVIWNERINETKNESTYLVVFCLLSGTEARDSPYLHPGSVDVYRERGGGEGGSSSRGRTGRESPRSALSSAHHRYFLFNLKN